MANRTAVYARTIHGTNPQYLIEKIIRTRIYESRFWKEDCFALTAELLVDKGAELRFVGGIYGGNTKPTPFMCLVLKLLQIQPEMPIIFEYIRQNYFKYLRALGAFYLRIIGTSQEVHTHLEPLLKDYRKLRRIDRMGEFNLYHMDELIDDLLHEDRVFDVILPRLTKRDVLEMNNELGPYVSEMDDAILSSIAGNNNLAHKQIDNKKLIIKKTDSRQHHDSMGNQHSRHVDRGSDHRHERRKDGDQHRHRRHEERHRRRRSSSYDTSDDDLRRGYGSRDDDDRDKAVNSKRPKTKADEIEEANVLRAKLGLKPLRP